MRKITCDRRKYDAEKFEKGEIDLLKNKEDRKNDRINSKNLSENQKLQILN